MEARYRQVSSISTFDRTAALSLQLVHAHDLLRTRLRDIRERLASAPDTVSGNDDLITHCLTFCAAVHDHHTGEDEGLFPALLRERPDLAQIVDRLVEDHQLIAGILREIDAVIAQAPSAPDPGAIGRQLDGLAAIVESHFAYEERRIAAALDVIDTGDAGDWLADVVDVEVSRTGESSV